MKKPFYVVSALVGLALAFDPAADPVRDVTSETQLLVDYRFIESSENLTLKVHRPTLPEEDVLHREYPWEKGGFAWASIAEDEGVYKLWYECSGWDSGRNSTTGRFLCYATSRDGVHWEKPYLGIIEYQGSRENNIVMAGTWGTVFIDPAGAPEQKYKYLGPMRVDAGWKESEGTNGSIYVCHSRDGIHWRRVPEAVLPFYCDTQNQAFWDQRTGKYVAYLRSWNDFLRTVSRVEVSDITRPWPYQELPDPYYKWGEALPPALGAQLPVVFTPDERDPFLSDHYNLCVIPYPYAQDVYFGLPSAYLHYDGPPSGGPPDSVNPRQSLSVASGNDGLLEIQLAVSRDGVRWTRPDRRAFIPIGLEGSGRASCLYAVPGVIRKKDELWFFFTATDTTHGGRDRGPDRDPDGPANFRKTHLRKAVIPLHRLVSASTGWDGGSLITPAMTFTGSRLELNIDTSAMGTARVELLDVHGNGLQGFSLDECDPISGNFLRRIVSWNGNTDLTPLVGQPVRLRLVSRNTDLYAFRFAIADRKE